MPFLTLPRELRNTIYHYYVFEAEGYHFDFKSGKLRASDNRPIDLALVYTCKCIATEMNHLALSNNVIHFSTTCSKSDSDRSKAGRFNVFFRELYMYKSAVLRSLGEPTLRRYATPELVARIAFRYPQFVYLIHLIHQPLDMAKRQPLAPDLHQCSSWGEANSTFRGFQDFLIELLSRDTDFPEALAKFYDDLGLGGPRYPESKMSNPFNRDVHSQHDPHSWSEMASFLRSSHLCSSPDPWSIPSENELGQMSTIRSPSFPKCNIWKRLKWRFSAAAAAIYFFKSIPHSTCLGVRNVVLHEDRQSVAYPECHALGLIPFCLRNPQLHIERRVNMWRNILTTLSTENELLDTDTYVVGNSSTLEMMAAGDSRLQCAHSKLSVIYFGTAFGKWITEASALFTKGMPIQSFSLVFDGDPAPDQTSDLFDVVKMLAAWQVAHAQWYAEKSLIPSAIKVRATSMYMSEAFPQVISDIIQGKSFIRCDFPTGEMYDPEQVLEKYRHLSPNLESPFPGGSWQKDHNRFFLYNYPRVRPSPPLPALLCDLALEDVMPE